MSDKYFRIKIFASAIAGFVLAVLLVIVGTLILRHHVTRVFGVPEERIFIYRGRFEFCPYPPPFPSTYSIPIVNGRYVPSPAPSLPTGYEELLQRAFFLCIAQSEIDWWPFLISASCAGPVLLIMQRRKNATHQAGAHHHKL